MDSLEYMISPLRKWMFSHYPFKKPIIVCISEERKRGKLSYCLWECCSWVIPKEIYPICVINTVKPCLTELGQHMLSWDYFRLSKAFALLFSKNLSLTHSIFSHGKHYYYYRLCLVNGLNVTFIYLIYHEQVSSRSLAALRRYKMGTSNY